MLKISAEILSKYSRFVIQNGIPKQSHCHYQKWLRYYRLSSKSGLRRYFPLILDENLCFLLDRIGESWFNVNIMRQINRKNTGNWWWPVEINSDG